MKLYNVNILHGSDVAIFVEGCGFPTVRVRAESTAKAFHKIPYKVRALITLSTPKYINREDMERLHMASFWYI